MKLYELTNQELELQAMMDDPDIDPDIVKDTLEGLHGELEEKLESCGKVLRGIDADISAIDIEIKRLQARKKTLENNKMSLKNYILTCMQAMNKKKIKTTLFSFTVKMAPQSIVIPNENDVPEQYRIKVPDKIDKEGIKKYLKEGHSVGFAYLKSGGPSLLIK